ncbi:MAG: hypothetical protein ABI036_11190 [Fibrobacteria bacterium]
MGRPPKGQDKRDQRVTLSLTGTDMNGLSKFEKAVSMDERAKAARLLFLDGLRHFEELWEKWGGQGVLTFQAAVQKYLEMRKAGEGKTKPPKGG